MCTHTKKKEYGDSGCAVPPYTTAKRERNCTPECVCTQSCNVGLGLHAFMLWIAFRLRGGRFCGPKRPGRVQGEADAKRRSVSRKSQPLLPGTVPLQRKRFESHPCRISPCLISPFLMSPFAICCRACFRFIVGILSFQSLGPCAVTCDDKNNGDVILSFSTMRKGSLQARDVDEAVRPVREAPGGGDRHS